MNENNNEIFSLEVQRLLNKPVSCHYSFIFDLMNIIKTSDGGMHEIAKKAKIGKESLYKSLAPGANPRFNTILKVIDALGFELQFKEKIDFSPKKERIVRFNSLLYTHPHLAFKWHTSINMTENNKILTPNDITYKNRKKIWWQCDQNHEWKLSCSEMIKNSKCPKC